MLFFMPPNIRAARRLWIYFWKAAIMKPQK